jgi:hypothetical protein
VPRSGEENRTVGNGGDGFGHAHAVRAHVPDRIMRQRAAVVVDFGSQFRSALESSRWKIARRLAGEDPADGNGGGSFLIGLPAALLGQRINRRSGGRIAGSVPRDRGSTYTVAAIELKR